MSARDPGTYARLHLAYFYDIGLPSRYAAPIQFLNTCRAACELGATATLYTNRLATSVEECLAFYGLAPHERLRIVPLFAAPWRGHALRRELGRLARDTDPRARRIILSRGESGIALAPHLARLRRDARGRDWRFVYEAHKLSFMQQAEPLRQAAVRPATRRRIERAVARTYRRERATIVGADGLICLTERLRAALAANFPVASPTLLLPSGVALLATPPAADEGRDIDILYAGKLERRKGVHDLIAALRALPGRRLWIAGGTLEELAALRRWAGEQGVADRVTFTGFIAPTRVGALYARARVGVCPLPVGESDISEHFTSPLKVLELMARGVPIVGTDVPALRELLDHGRTALLARPSDPPALARAIGALLADRALAGRLAGAARVRAEEYSWSGRARRLLTFLGALP